MLIAAIGFALIASAIGWGIVFALGDELIARADRVRYAVLWFAVTLLLFVTPSGILFLLALGTVLAVMGNRRGADPLALGLLIILAVPAAGLLIEGLPGINYLINLTVALICSIVLFLPGFLSRPKPHRSARAKRELAIVDAAVIALFLTLLVLDARGTNFTSNLRNLTEWSFRLLVPYLAFSRVITTPERLDYVMRVFLVGIVVAGAVALFIAILQWQFYAIPDQRLFGQPPAMLVWRLGLMRSAGPLGASPISFGAVSMIAVGVAIGVGATMEERWRRWLLIAMPVIAVFATVSRGPLLGMFLIAGAYQLTKPNPVGASVKAGLLGLVGLIPLALFTSFGRSLLTLVPGLTDDSVDQGSVDYREELLRIGLRVARKNPLFGDRNYRLDPEMQELVQGQGIIDVVNTYLYYALNYGFVTMSLYVFILFATLASLFATVRKLPTDTPTRLREVGGGLFAALAAFIVVVFTTTSVTGLLPSFTWIFMGVCVAYVRVARAYAPAAARAGVRARSDEEPIAEVYPGAPRPAAALHPASRPEPTSASEPDREPFGLPTQPKPSLPPGPRW